jgi:hypothetical protein
VLEPVMAEAELLTGDGEVLAAEALIKRDQRKLRDKDKPSCAAQAKALLERAKGKGADPPSWPGSPSWSSPGLAATLGVPPPRRPPPRPSDRPAAPGALIVLRPHRCASRWRRRSPRRGSGVATSAGRRRQRRGRRDRADPRPRARPPSLRT